MEIMESYIKLLKIASNLIYLNVSFVFSCTSFKAFVFHGSFHCFCSFCCSCSIAFFKRYIPSNSISVVCIVIKHAPFNIRLTFRVVKYAT